MVAKKAMLAERQSEGGIWREWKREDIYKRFFNMKVLVFSNNLKKPLCFKFLLKISLIQRQMINP